MTSPATTQKRKAYSIAEKVDIIDHLHAGQTQSQISKETGVAESTLRGWLKDEGRLRASVVSSEERKRQRAAQDPQLDAAMATWLSQARKDGTPITGSVIQNQAKKIHSMLKPGEEESFAGSNGWLRGFKSRHGINKSKTMSSRSAGRSRHDGNKSQPSSANASDDDTVDEVEINSDSDGSDDGNSNDSASKPKARKRGESSLNKSALSMPQDVKKLMERVLCCSCGKQLNPMITGSIRKHPWLKVVTCKKCYKFLRSGPFTMDKDGIDEQCRWCGDGGRLYGCDYCNHCFCRHCIKRNLGRSEAAKMEDDIGAKWHCYMCKPKQIAKLQQDCIKILEYIEKEDQKEKDKQERAKQREKEKEEAAKKEREEKAKAKADRREKEIKKEKDEKRKDDGKVKIENTNDKTKETPKKGLPAPKSRDVIAEELNIKTAKVETSEDDVIVLNSPEKMKDSIPHFQHHRATLYKPDAKTGVTNVVKGGNVLQVTVGPKKPLPVSMPYKDKELKIAPRTVGASLPLIGNPPVAIGNNIRNLLTSTHSQLNRGLQNQIPAEKNDINALKSVIYPFNVEEFVEKLNSISSSFNLSISSIKTDLAIAKLTNANTYNAKNTACSHLKTALDVFFSNIRNTFNVKMTASLPGAKTAPTVGATGTSILGAAAGEPMPDVITLLNPTVNQALGKVNNKAIVIDDSSKDEDSCVVIDDCASDKVEKEKKVNGEDCVVEINENFIEDDTEKGRKEKGRDKDKSKESNDSKENGVENMEVDDNDDENKDEKAEEETSPLDVSENAAAKLELLKELEDELTEDDGDNVENDDSSEEEEPKETKRSTRYRGNDKKEEKDSKLEKSDSTSSSRSRSPQKKSSKSKADSKETETESEMEKQEESSRRRSGRISELKDNKADSIDESVDDTEQDGDDEEESASPKRSSRSKTRGKKSDNTSNQEGEKKGEKRVDKESEKLLKKSISSRSLRSDKESKDSEDDFQPERSSSRSKSPQKKSSKNKDTETESESEKQEESSRRRSGRISELKDSKADNVEESVDKDVQSDKKTLRSKGGKDKDLRSKHSEKSKSGKNKETDEDTNDIDHSNTEDNDEDDHDADDSSAGRSSRRKSNEKQDTKSPEQSGIEKKSANAKDKNKKSENSKDSEKKSPKGKQKSCAEEPAIGENGDLSSESENDDSDSDVQEPEFGRRKKRKAGLKEKSESQDSDSTTTAKQTKSKQSKSDKSKKSDSKESSKKSGKEEKTECRKSERNKAKKEETPVSDSDSEFDPELEKEIQSLSKKTKLTKKKAASTAESKDERSKGKNGDKEEIDEKDKSKGKKGKRRSKDEDIEIPLDSDDDDDNDEDDNTEVDDVASESSTARETCGSRQKEKNGKASDSKTKSGGSLKKSGRGLGIYSSDSDDDDDDEGPPDDSDDSDTSEELSASQIKRLEQAERKAKESDDDSEFGEEIVIASEESSDPEISFKDTPKKGKKKKKFDSASEDSDFVTPKKKKKHFRNDLLDARISDSEEEEKKPKGKGKGKGKRKKPEDSQDSDASSDDGKKKGRGGKGKKRRRIKKLDSSDEEKEPGAEDELVSGSEEGDPDTPGGYLKRRKIRKVQGVKKLDKSTKAAQKAEEERRKRIEERQKEYNTYVETEGGEEEGELPEGTEREIVSEEKTDSISQILGTPKKVPVTTKCVLEMDKVKKKPLIEVNRTLVRKLKPHQVEAVRFMYNCCVESVERLKKETGAGCILAHCMGLGKTLSVISFVHTMLSNVKHTKMKRCLVVCPLNTCLNWVNEFEIWLEDVDFEIDVYEMSKVKQNFERAQMLKEWCEGDAGVLIMGYEMYRNLVQGSHCRNKKQKKIFYEALADPGPDIVICDEGHILKNDDTSLSKSMNKITSKRRVVLTGTPLQNNLREYHCMVNFVKPSLLGTRKEFFNRFANPITNGQCSDSTPQDVKLMKRRAHILHELLAGCVQRKDYSALTKFLPPKHEYVISIRLSPIQMTLYEKYLELSGTNNEIVSKGARLFKDYQNLMRIWTHPWVMKLDEIRQENKRAMEDTDEDSFIDDYDSEDSFIDDTASSLDSSDSEVAGRGKGKGKGKKGKGKAKKKRGTPSSSSDEDENIKKKADGDEVVKKWTSKTRGNEEGAGSSWMQDLGYQTGPKELSSEWWAEFVKEEDENKLELSGKLMLLFEILKMCEDIGDKVLVFSQSLLSLDIIEDFLEKIDTAHQDEMNAASTEGASSSSAGASGSAGASSGGAGGSGSSSGGVGGSGSGGSGEKSEEEKKKEALRERFSKYGKSWTKGADYFRMDGSTSSVHRKAAQDMFNDPDNYRARLFLISTKAGSLGINLVSANRVIIFDASWNPSHDIQSIFRVYRFGQVKPVYVYRFLAQGTMEEKIYERQVTKQSLSQRVVDEHQIERHFTTSDLQELYKFTPDRLDDPNRVEKIPVLPKDHMLAELMTTNKEWITTFHEHDSLLENKVEQELNEEEKKAAWEDYENEKKGLITNASFGGMGNNAYLNPAIMATQQMNMQSLLLQGQNTLGQAAVLQIVQDLKNRFPNTPPEIFQQRVQAVLRQVLTQQIMQQSAIQRRQMEQQRMNELNRLNQIKQQIERQQAMLSNQHRGFSLNAPASLGHTGSFVNLANPASGYATSTSGMVHPQSMPNLRLPMMGNSQNPSTQKK